MQCNKLNLQFHEVHQNLPHRSQNLDMEHYIRHRLSVESFTQDVIVAHINKMRNLLSIFRERN